MGRHSIKAKIAFGITAMLVVMTAALAVNTVQASRAVREQAVSTYRTTGAAIMEQIDFQLEGADAHLHALTASDYNLQIIRNSLNADEVTFANVRFQSVLSTTLSANQMVGSFFLYDGTQERYWDVYNPNSTYEERERIRHFLRTELADSNMRMTISEPWFVHQISGSNYLLNIKQYGKIYLGAWVSAETLYASLGANGEDAAFALVTDGGEIMAGGWGDVYAPVLNYAEHTAVMDTGEELLIGSHSGQGDFSLVARLSNKKLLEGLPHWYHFVLIALCCVAALMPILIVFFYHAITKPVESIVHGLRTFGEGNVDARMALREEEGEFCTLKQEFNQMADQIKTLQIDVYEEKLERQKAELQYLEMQINPHFFLNALNGIYAFAIANNMEMVCRMILLLSGYLRQQFQNSFTFIPLREELEQTQRYLEIQQIRFQNRITAEIRIPEFLLDTTVPALCLHTFVDNAIKHQMSTQNSLHITITAQMVLDGDTPCLWLRVQDNGKGFSKEALETALGDQPATDEKGDRHIGIWNFRKRLNILYGGSAKIGISNIEPCGAAIDIYIPALRKERELDEGADC